jgi:hypothetical protein
MRLLAVIIIEITNTFLKRYICIFRCHMSSKDNLAIRADGEGDTLIAAFNALARIHVREYVTSVR